MIKFSVNCLRRFWFFLGFSEKVIIQHKNLSAIDVLRLLKKNKTVNFYKPDYKKSNKE